MTKPTQAATWQEENSLYLSAAIAWLRLHLAWCAERGRTAGTDSKPATASRRKKETATRPATETKAAESLEERVAEAQLEMDTVAGRMTSYPALVFLAQALGLSKFETEIVLLCAAVEFDSSIPELCAQISGKAAAGSSGSEMPTFALALTVFDDPAWDALSPDGPLRYWRLLEIDQPGFQSLTSSPLRVDERMVGFLKGLNRLDDRLVPFLTPIPSPTGLGVALPPSQQVPADAIAAQWERGGEGGFTPSLPSIPLVQLLGPDYASKQNIAASVAAALGHRLFRMAADALPTQVAEIETLSRLWQRESRLIPVALLVDAQTPDSPLSEAQAAVIRRFLSRTVGLIFLCTRDGWSVGGRDSCSFEVASPTRDEQRAAWMAALGTGQGATAGSLAAQFNLTLTDIQRIAEEVSAYQKGGQSQPDRLWDQCLAKVRPVLDKLARRIQTRVTWQDIVLPEEQEMLLHQIGAQVRERATVYEDWGFSTRMSRGLGISALFTGESGTGKTMAAEVIAHELRLNLYRIDLSAVVSKYIGETEKNLALLFDAAENGGAILFFDEADALFGKRSEVKDSHDRYANIEINYLLQRMESYSGLAILATNMRSALDVAFTRRLRFIVNFPFPGVADRKRLWMKAYPAKTPLQQLDYDRLARFNLTGGSISNVAINSAFLAAHAEGRVNMTCALAAIRQEFIKLDRPINRADFVWHEEQNEEVGELTRSAGIGERTGAATAENPSERQEIA